MQYKIQSLKRLIALAKRVPSGNMATKFVGNTTISNLQLFIGQEVLYNKKSYELCGIEINKDSIQLVLRDKQGREIKKHPRYISI